MSILRPIFISLLLLGFLCACDSGPKKKSGIVKKRPAAEQRARRPLNRKPAAANPKAVQAANLAKKKKAAALKKKRDRELAVALARDKKQREHKILGRMRKVRGSKGITWYYPRSAAFDKNKDDVFLYLGMRKSGPAWIRLRMQVYPERPIGITSYQFISPEAAYKPQRANFKQQRHGASSVEWYDVSLSGQELAVFKQVMFSKKLVVRYKGRGGEIERKVKKVKPLKQVLEAYELLRMR